MIRSFAEADREIRRLEKRIGELQKQAGSLRSQVLSVAGINTIKDWTVSGVLVLELGDTLVLDTGEITVTSSQHKIDTEGAAATDDLDTINGGVDGQILVLRTTDGGRDVDVKDGTGNIQLDAATDFSMTSVRHRIMLINQNDTTWVEISRSTT
jgi:hypothetical protein